MSNDEEPHVMSSHNEQYRSHEKHIQVMELFGPTIQGEGIMTGTLTHFLRTGGCSLRCSWCDSMFAVDPQQIKEQRALLTTDQILKLITQLPPAPYITFTGGDPAIQDRLGDLIPTLNFWDMHVAVETQGMFFPDWFENVDVLTFSPKGPSSGNIVDPTSLVKWLTEHRQTLKSRVCIKVVVFMTGKEFTTNEAPGDEDPRLQPIEELETDLEYAMRLFELIPEQLYDAFYFTAGTLPIETFGDPGSRILETVHSERLLSEALMFMLREGGGRYKFNHKVHVGCQQHVLLWPTEEKGV